MKLLIVSQYFWPENFRVNELSKDLCDRGHQVTVLTGYPNYPEGKINQDFKKNREKYDQFDNVKIIRVPIFARGKNKVSLFLNYISFPLSAIFYLLFNKKKINFDKIIVYQLSPIFSALPAIFLKKFTKTPVVIWVLDLWPDTLLNFGFSKNSFVYRIVDFITSFIYKNCDLILLQTKSMLNELCKRHPEIRDNAKYLPSWADQTFNKEIIGRNKSKKFKIIFAGNIGYAQDYESIISCMEILYQQDKNIILEVIGDGSVMRKFKTKAKQMKLNNIIFRGRHPIDHMPKFYSEADIFLVTLKKSDAFDYVLPAKVQTYMLSKKPIIGMANGETKKIILEANCGSCVASGEYKLLANNIIAMKKLSPADIEMLANNGFQYCIRNYDKQNLLEKLDYHIQN